MELTDKDANYITLRLEPEEQNLIILSLMFSGVPTKGGINGESKEKIFSGSQGVYAIKDILDPHAKQRVERNNQEREEYRKRGEKWKRRGIGVVEPIYVRLTRGDVTSLKRLFDIVATNEIFMAQVKDRTGNELVKIRDALSKIVLILEPS